MDPTYSDCNKDITEACGECQRCKYDQRARERAEGLLKIIRKYEPPPPPEPEPPAPPKVLAERCVFCSKRIGPIGYFCRCDGCFCSKHRLPEQHDCNYDYISEGKVHLTKANPEIIPPKFRRI